MDPKICSCNTLVIWNNTQVCIEWKMLLWGSDCPGHSLVGKSCAFADSDKIKAWRRERKLRSRDFCGAVGRWPWPSPSLAWPASRAPSPAPGGGGASPWWTWGGARARGTCSDTSWPPRRVRTASTRRTRSSVISAVATGAWSMCPVSTTTTRPRVGPGLDLDTDSREAWHSQKSEAQSLTCLTTSTNHSGYEDPRVKEMWLLKRISSEGTYGLLQIKLGSEALHMHIRQLVKHPSYKNWQLAINLKL